MTDLLARIHEVNLINPPAEMLIDNDPNSVLVAMSDNEAAAGICGHLTACTDGAGGWVIGVYDLDAWKRGTADALLFLATTDEVVEACDYLLNDQPEGTDWSAWATQRILDGIAMGETEHRGMRPEDVARLERNHAHQRAVLLVRPAVTVLAGTVAEEIRRHNLGQLDGYRAAVDSFRATLGEALEVCAVHECDLSVCVAGARTDCGPHQ